MKNKVNSQVVKVKKIKTRQQEVDYTKLLTTDKCVLMLKIGFNNETCKLFKGAVEENLKLTLKAPSNICGRRHSNFCLFSDTIRLDISSLADD